MTKNEYNQNPNKCKYCNEPIVVKDEDVLAHIRVKKFCNSSCAASYNNSKIPKRVKTIYKCKECGKELIRKGTYCNQKCKSDFEQKTYIDKWKKGEETGISGDYQISHRLKRYLKEKYNNKCSICGWNEINPHTKNVPLEVEHIDGDYTNNNESNLTLLCPNCHSLTATYKGANKGRGRKERSKYN